MKKSILLTAVSGSGKSTIYKELVKSGYEAYDIEENDELFTMYDKSTGEVVQNIDNDNLEVIKRHHWVCNPSELKKLISKQKSELAFYCGASSNFDEIYNIFDRVVMLQVSDKTTIKRLKNRKPGEYGNNKATQNWILTWKHEAEKNCIEKGAIALNAEPNPQTVAKSLLSLFKK